MDFLFRFSFLSIFTVHCYTLKTDPVCKAKTKVKIFNGDRSTTVITFRQCRVSLGTRDALATSKLEKLYYEVISNVHCTPYMTYAICIQRNKIVCKLNRIFLRWQKCLLYNDNFHMICFQFDMSHVKIINPSNINRSK